MLATSFLKFDQVVLAGLRQIADSDSEDVAHLQDLAGFILRKAQKHFYLATTSAPTLLAMGKRNFFVS